MTDAAPNPTADDQPTDFESSLEQIETIIRRIEAGEIGLEESLTEYKRGAGLIDRCRKILTDAEQQVESLTRRMLSSEEQGQDEPPV